MGRAADEPSCSHSTYLERVQVQLTFYNTMRKTLTETRNERGEPPPPPEGSRGGSPSGI